MSIEVRSDFESYLTKYCEEYCVSREEALTHKIVQYVKQSYDEAIAALAK